MHDIPRILSVSWYIPPAHTGGVKQKCPEHTLSRFPGFNAPSWHLIRYRRHFEETPLSSGYDNNIKTCGKCQATDRAKITKIVHGFSQTAKSAVIRVICGPCFNAFALGLTQSALDKKDSPKVSYISPQRNKMNLVSEGCLHTTVCIIRRE